MRLYGISLVDVEAAVRRPVGLDRDERGNPLFAGLTHGGHAIIVVVAFDDPDFVITTFPDD